MANDLKHEFFSAIDGDARNIPFRLAKMAKERIGDGADEIEAGDAYLHGLSYAAHIILIGGIMSILESYEDAGQRQKNAKHLREFVEATGKSLVKEFDRMVGDLGVNLFELQEGGES